MTDEEFEQAAHDWDDDDQRAVEAEARRARAVEEEQAYDLAKVHSALKSMNAEVKRRTAEHKAELASLRASNEALVEALKQSDRANQAAHVCIRENLPGFVGDLHLLAEAMETSRAALADAQKAGGQ